MTQQRDAATPSATERLINRRAAIARVAGLLGGATLVGGSALLAACERERRPVEGGVIGEFTPEDIAFLDEVADTILPDTDTPGAKAAEVGAFMALMVTDTYQPRDQTVFREGMRTLDAESRREAGTSFVTATAAQRLALLERLDREQKEHSDARAARGGEGPAHYFRMMKQLTLLGYFTSEIGCTQAQRYAETPGRYDPCAPHQPGDRSWAGHA